MEGKVLNITEVPDPVFSQKCMGDGFAIELTRSKVIAPLSGEIVSTFPTGHAFGIKCDDNIEVLIHIGIDTVQLNGNGFDVKVNQGVHVKQGDVLVEVDLKKIKEGGKSLISPVIFTSGETVILSKSGKQVSLLEKDIVKY